MREKTKKATFSLHADVLAALDEAMSRGTVPSKNALVEQALVKELKALKRRERDALWQEAAKDPLFLKDIQDVEDDFRYADAEAARDLDDDRLSMGRSSVESRPCHRGGAERNAPCAGSQ